MKFQERSLELEEIRKIRASEQQTILTNTIGTDEDQKNATKANTFYIWKNLLSLCFAFCFLSAAMVGVNSLQSSVNFEGGLGVITTSIYYGTAVPVLLFMGIIITRILGLKYAIIPGLAIHVLYFVSFVYPSRLVSIPSAVMTGILTPCMWSAKNAYIGHLGSLADELDPTTRHVDRFFGIYYMFYYFANIVATLFEHFVTEINEQIHTDDSKYCGIDFCDVLMSTNDTNFESISANKRYILFGGYAGMAAIAVVLVVFGLDQVRIGPPLKLSEYPSQSLSIIRHLGNTNQLLLSVANVYRGASTAFLTADFTKAFITCSFGVSSVGFAIMTYGVSSGAASFIFSHLEKRFGRLPFFFCFLTSHVLAIIAMFTWLSHPQDKSLTTYLVIAGVWGIGQSVMDYQFAGLHSHLFPDKETEAFYLINIQEDLGESLCYALSYIVCFSTKLYIMSTWIGLLAFCYLFVTIRTGRTQNSSNL